jgi:glycerol-3-phosphate dehydrogenase
VSIAVLERENDVASGATKANTAIVHSGYDPKPGTLMARYNVQGNAMIKRLCGLLDVPYRQCGSLTLAFSPEEIKLLDILMRQGEANGVPGLELLDSARLHEIEPNVGDEAITALYAPSAGIVSPWELALALAEGAVERGAELLLEDGVDGIEKVAGGFRIMAEQGSLEARFILNAAGIRADEIHDMAAPHAFRIIPDRGEYYLLDKSEGSRLAHVVFQCPDEQGKGTVVAPTVHGNLIVGPNNEPPRFPEDTATTSEGLAIVAQRAKRSVPSVNLRECIRNFAGVRAAADVDDFIIAEAPGAPGFIDLAGIKSPGLTAAPAIAEAAVELLARSGLALAKKASRPSGRKRLRFFELSPAEKADLIRRDAAYGQVVCRCETVTEGEILAALRAPVPPRSIDGVKRRVGTGMGRCQGGFCGPRVLEILARATGLRPWDVHQDLRGSQVLIGETKANEANEKSEHE